jgi:hypothetical protein
VSGLLWPGFSKQLDEQAGTTYLWGVPIGGFDVVAARGNGPVELRYRRWPVVDVLDGTAGEGLLRLPGGRRWRFCRFRLEP